jgi:hypothetical protein
LEHPGVKAPGTPNTTTTRGGGSVGTVAPSQSAARELAHRAARFTASCGEGEASPSTTHGTRDPTRREQVLSWAARAATASWVAFGVPRGPSKGTRGQEGRHRNARARTFRPKSSHAPHVSLHACACLPLPFFHFHLSVGDGAQRGGVEEGRAVAVGLKVDPQVVLLSHLGHKNHKNHKNHLFAHSKI